MAKGVYIGVNGKARKVRKMYAGVEDRYTLLDYIQSSGTQYIDTGFIPNQNTKIEMRVQTTQARACGIAATDQNWGSKAFGIWGNAAAYGSETNSNVALYGANPVTVVLDKNKMYQDGSLLWTAGAQAFQCPSSLTLFALNRNGSITEYTAMKLYSCKLYDNGILVRDLKPCRSSGGAVGLYDAVNGAFYGNQDTGNFTAGAETGETVTSPMPRKIKRGYIGIGGVARPFWIGEKALVSYGPIIAMSTVRCGHAGGTVGNYALFAGGQDANTYVSTVDTYNTALTRGSAPNLNAAVWSHAAASVGDYVIFAGGENGYYQSTATAYNRSLTRSSPASLSSTKTGLTSASVGSYALFAGGSRGSGPLKTVDAYNTSLTRTTVADLSVERQYAAGAGINGYALFSGGRDAGYDAVNSVDAYNTSLTRSTAASLSEKKNDHQGATVNGCAVFAGGESPGALKTVDVYDTSLTKKSAAPLSVGMNNFASASIDDFAIFAGGQNANGAVNAYSKSLTRSTLTLNSGAVKRTSFSGARVGGYALFSGGLLNGTEINSVEAFTAL